MPPKKDKKKDKKGSSTDDASSPIDTAEISLLRSALTTVNAPQAVSPLPQRYEPNPIDLQTLLPEWSIDIVRDPATWETSADEDGKSLPFTQSGAVGLPDTLTSSSSSSSKVQWKRAVDVLPTPAYVAPVEEEEGDGKKKADPKKDAKKKPDKGAAKKGKDGGATEVKVWEEVSI